MAPNDMDSATTSIVKLGDTNHPLVHLTKQNETIPFFKMIPRDVRLMIYEYAVAVEEPIRPKQVKKRSNKFVWGKLKWGSQDTMFHNLLEEQFFFNDDEQLVVVLLSRVCRTIYQELETWPVFYRVNTFEFPCEGDIRPFLAAITPQRRAMIRTIAIQSRLDQFDPRDDARHKWKLPETNYDGPNELALLAQCHDLRKISYSLYTGKIVDPGLVHCLKAILASVKKPCGVPSPWNLPFIELKVDVGQGTPIALGDSDHIPVTAWPAWIHLPSRRVISEINNAMVMRKRLFKDAQDAQDAQREEMGGQASQTSPKHQQYRPQWFKDMDDDVLVARAISDTGIDFPGENRIARAFIEDPYGPISSRTRRKPREYNNLSGTSERIIPMYNTAGMLARDFLSIQKVRWNDSREVECEVFWADSTIVPRTSWQPIHCILTEYGEDALRRFYSDLFFRIHLLDVHSVHSGLENMRNTVSPADLDKYVGGFIHCVDGDDSTPKHIERRRVSSWKRYISDWDAALAEVEDMIAAYEKEAEEKAEEEAKKRAKGKAKGTKQKQAGKSKRATGTMLRKK